MKKSVKLILLSASAVICGVSAAFIAGCKKHNHTYEEKWSYDSDQHWHYASCEGHEKEKGYVANHNFENKVCTVCGYINKLTYDMSGVVFADEEVDYDGLPHSIVATNLPEGVGVLYENNAKTTAGTYTVTAHFFGDTENYLAIPDMTAKLTINKATVDMSGVVFEGDTIKYDEQYHALEAKNVPEGVIVTYYYNGEEKLAVREAGEYTVTAKFRMPDSVKSNYKPIADMTAQLNITRESHTVTFKQEGYDDIKIPVKNLASLTGSDIPTPVQKPGYRVFWNPEDLAKLNRIVGDVTVNAMEEEATYNITYHTGGAANSPLNPTEYTMFESEDIALVPITRPGYTFQGWHKDSPTGAKITSIVKGSYGDLDLYAEWEAIEYTITYYLDEGTNAAGNPHTYTVETPDIVLEAPTREGYSFMGWYEDEAFLQPITEIPVGSIGDYELYARWEYGTEGLIFELDGNNNYVVTGYKGAAEIVDIPDEWSRRAVVGIKANAFRSNSAIKEVIIPARVDNIEANAFINCTNLMSVILPDGVFAVSSNAFSGCSKLTVFTPAASRMSGWSNGWIDETRVFWNYGGEHGVTEDGIVWGLTLSGGVTIIKKIGEGSAITIPATVNGHSVTLIKDRAFESDTKLLSVSISGSGLAIGSRAFQSCVNLTEITIGAGVSTIGARAFQGCGALTSLHFEESVVAIYEYAFYGCELLEGIVIPLSCTYIGEKAFAQCPDITVYAMAESQPGDWKAGWLEEERPFVFNYGGEYGSEQVGEGAYHWALLNDGTVAIVRYSGNPVSLEIASKLGGKDVTHISTNAFLKLTALQNLVLPKSLKSIAVNAISGCNNVVSVTIPFIGSASSNPANNKFAYVLGLTNDKLPQSLKEVTIVSGPRVYGASFEGCEHLTTVTILPDPDFVKEGEGEDADFFIGVSAFRGCRSLKNLTLGEGVSAVRTTAFANCTSLETLVLPDSVVYIRDNAFNGCTSLTNVTIGKGVRTIEREAFSGCTKIKTVYFNAEGCNVMSYENGGTYVSVFAASNHLDTLVVGNSARYIPEYAFYNCDNLVNVTMGEQVARIGQYAFANCSSISRIAIPDKVLSIENNAFENCSSLSDLTIGNAVDEIKEYAFSNCESITKLLIPDSVRLIDAQAFMGCAKLERMMIGRGVAIIGEFAFAGCSELKTIYYHAGATEWAILYEDYIVGVEGNANLMNATVHLFSQENPYENGFIDGNYWHYNELGEIETWPTEGLLYALNPDGQSYYVKGVIRLDGTTVEILSSYNGRPVTVIGAQAFNNNKILESVVIPESIEKIDDYAFGGCSALTSISPLRGVVTIGSHAFDGCSNLSSIDLGSKLEEIGSYAFNGCKLLQTIPLPEGLLRIEERAFNGCEALTRIDVPSTVTFLGLRLFVDCVNFANITVASGNAYYRSSGDCLIEISSKMIIAGTNNSVIPEDPEVTSIREYAFYKRIGLKSITIPGNITDVNSYAFSYCSGLKEVTIKQGVSKIGTNVFEFCTALTSVTFPDSVGSITNGVFSGCSELQSVHFGSGVSLIHYTAFLNCPKLEEITISANNPTYKCVNNCIIRKSDGTLILGLKGSEIPNDGSVKAIGEYAFYNCAGLESITIPDSVTTLGNYSFYNCSSLLSITIPGSVTTFGNRVFYGCTKITTVVIGEGVTAIGEYAFYNCIALSSVTIAKSVKNIGNYAFGVTRANEDTAAAITFYYNGSADDWQSVTIGSNNSRLRSDNVQFLNVTGLSARVPFKREEE